MEGMVEMQMMEVKCEEVDLGMEKIMYDNMNMQGRKNKTADQGIIIRNVHSIPKQTIENEIQIEETGPDFFVRGLENFLVGAEYCDLLFVCSENQVLQAHCAVVSAVSEYVREILRDARSQQENIHLQLPDVSLRDIQSFLELVYTGSVSVTERRRLEFLQLLHLLEVNNCIEVIESQQTENKRFIRKDMISEFPSPTSILSKLASPPSSKTKKPAKSRAKKRKMREENDVVEVPVNFCSMEPTSPDPALGVHHLPSFNSDTPVLHPPVKQHLLAQLQGQNGENMAEEIAKADLATKAWLQSSSIKVPQMMTNGDGELVLSHIDPISSSSSRKCERCRCPMCMDVNRVQLPGEPSLHLCHYPECGKIYKKTSHLRAHLRWHIGDQPYPCSWPGCTKRFTRSDELHRHFRIHTGERRHKCTECDKSFSRSDHLKKHFHSHHSQESVRAAGHHAGVTEVDVDPAQLLEVESYSDSP